MDRDPSMREHDVIDVGKTAQLTEQFKEADRRGDAEWERTEKKARLIGSEEKTMVTMLSISEVRLENFDITRFTEVDMSSLEQAGLDSFVKLLSEIPSIAMPDVDAFVRTYRDKKREGYILREGKLIPVQLNEETVAVSLKLPCAGLKLNDLVEKNYPIGDCLWLDCQSGQGLDTMLQKTHLNPEWRKWVELVQVWLLLDMNPTKVSRRNVVAAAAVRSGVKINWARFLMREMHKDVLQRKARNCSYFAAAQYISKLVGDVCPPIPLLGDVDVQPKVEPHPWVSSNDAGTEMQMREGEEQLPIVTNQSASGSKEMQMREGEEQLPIAYDQSASSLKEQVEEEQVEKEQVEEGTNAALSDLKERLGEEIKLSSSLKVEIGDLKHQLAAKTNLLRNANIQLESLSQQLEQKGELLRNENLQLENFKLQVEKKAVSLKDTKNELQYARSEIDALKRVNANLSRTNKALETASLVERSTRDALEQKVEELKFELKQMKLEFLCSGSDSDPDLETRRPRITEEHVLWLSENAPPASSIEMAYAWERDVLFVVTGLTYKEYVNSKRWAEAWDCAIKCGKENLLVEIVIRGELILQNQGDAFSYIGDYGCSFLLGLGMIERDLARRRATEKSFWERSRQTPIVSQLDVNLVFDLTGWTDAQFLRWKARVRELKAEYQNTAWIRGMITNAQERQGTAKMIDLHPAIYLRTYRAGERRIQNKSTIKNLATSVMAMIASSAEVSYQVTSIGVDVERLPGMTVDLQNWALPTSPRTDEKYLGRWTNLFDVQRNSPFPTFEALLWIAKDHPPDLRPPMTSFQKMQYSDHRRRCITYPPLVAADDRLCRECNRRYTWYVDQKLDDVWYNWPIIPGSFKDVPSCIEAYTKFSQVHLTHRDPTCYRAAIFCAILAYWCNEHNVVIDVRVGGRHSQDMLLYNKLHYASCRKIRPLELMIITQFLEQGHDVLSLDMHPSSRATAMKSFMDNQKYYEHLRQTLGQTLAQEEAEMLKTRGVANA